MKHFVLSLCLSLPTLAVAQNTRQPDHQSDAIALLEHGVICAPPTTGQLDAPGTVAGTTHLIAQEPPFVSTGQRVPAVIGIGFGIKAQSRDINGISGVTMQITHPPMGADDAQLQSFTTSIRGTDPSLTFYQFDFDYELLPGIWQMEAIKDGTLLYRTTFEVVMPDQLPELASICGFEDLIG